MLFSELEERLGDYGPRGYYLLESFILQLLNLEATAFGQQIHLVESHGSRFDAFAPQGFGTIDKPLAIEIVSVLSPKRLIELSQILEREVSNGPHALLLIAFRTLGQHSNLFQNIRNALHGKLFICGVAEIQAIMNRHEDAVRALSDSLFSSSLKMAIDRSSDDWKLQREKTLSEVAESYRASRFSMWLGAGVSSSAGLPDWDTLLNSLFVSMLMEEDEKKTEDGKIKSIVNRLRDIDGPSALMLARYIRKGMSSGSTTEQEKFLSTVTQQLYSLRNRDFAIDSSLIKAIVALCTPGRTGARIRAVVTYNFDDLLERQLSGRELSFRSIFEEMDMASHEELPIYHVHGFLPERREDYPNLDKSTLVFSEEGYHQIYRDAYHWSNLIQLNNLKETTCLMVGLSLTDPNLRRLLEIAVKSLDKPKHFAFMKRISVEAFAKQNGANAVTATRDQVRKFLQRHHNLNEQVMRELGVNIIWYESYDEIPQMLTIIGKKV